MTKRQKYHRASSDSSNRNSIRRNRLWNNRQKSPSSPAQRWFLKPFTFVLKNKVIILPAALLALVAGIFLYESLLRTVTIEPFELNQEFQKDIYGSEIMATNLEHEIALVIQEAKSSKTAQRLDSPLSDRLPAIEVLPGKFSTKSIFIYLRECFPVGYLRGLFGYETVRFDGTAVLLGDTVRISLKVSKNSDREPNGQTTIFERKSDQLNLLLKEVGEFIVSDSEPYLFASYQYQHKRNDQALVQIQKCLRETPDENAFFALILWGLILDEEKKDDQAIEKFEEASKYEKPGEIKPKAAVLYNLWGQALLHKNLTAEAIEKFETAIKHDPTFAPTFSNYGVALKKEGRREEALSNFEHALYLDRNLPEANYNLALYIEDQDSERAYSLFLTAISLDPDYSPAYREVGRLLGETPSKREEGLKYINKAIQLDNNYAAAFNSRAQIMTKFGQARIQEAVADSKRAVELYEDQLENNKDDKSFKDDYVTAVNNLGWAYELSGDNYNALKYYQKSVDIKSDYFTGYTGVGDIDVKLQRYDEALTNYDKALTPESDQRGYAYIHEASALAERSRNRPKELATQDLRKADSMIKEGGKINPSSDEISKIQRKIDSELNRRKIIL